MKSVLMKIVESIDFVEDAVDASESIIHVSLAHRHVVRASSPSTCPFFINVICQLKEDFFFTFPSDWHAHRVLFQDKHFSDTEI